MKNKNSIPWWLIIAMFIFFWPVGMGLMFIKLFGENKDGKRAQYRKGEYRFSGGYVDVPYSSSDAEVGAKINRPAGDQSMFSLKKGGVIKGLGISLTVLGVICSALSFLGTMVSSYSFLQSAIISSMVFISMGAPGLAIAFWGNSTLGKAQRYRRYSHMIGDSEEVSLDRLAGAMGVSYEKVCADLHKMLDNGFFEGYYIDHELRVMTTGRLSGGMTAREAEDREQQADHTHQINPADRILEINNSIKQPEVSEKVTRLEGLTRRIYNYTDAYPHKEKYAKSFKERYLPKTIKILESYSRFERSGSSGENVRAAMKDVEAVLDVLIGSFEKQLDMLYMDEALDVTTDIDVLESMISGDGLGDNPFSMRQEGM
ncbi:MAG: 5-bromo-4-chloroindolyl phosphate hydrolysis family protein [Clostridiaceae bacterium]|nr:5-bromo-4-chloroindolyl phosphate hydrolysis family protein [Clostridiaceae bacterium]